MDQWQLCCLSYLLTLNLMLSDPFTWMAIFQAKPQIEKGDFPSYRNWVYLDFCQQRIQKQTQTKCSHNLRMMCGVSCMLFLKFRWQYDRTWRIALILIAGKNPHNPIADVPVRKLHQWQAVRKLHQWQDVILIFFTFTTCIRKSGKLFHKKTLPVTRASSICCMKCTHVSIANAQPYILCQGRILHDRNFLEKQLSWFPGWRRAGKNNPDFAQRLAAFCCSNIHAEIKMAQILGPPVFIYG